MHTLAYIPSPTFSQFQIGPLTIHMYAITMLTGMIVAVWILTHRWKKLGGTFDQVLDVALISIVFGLIGARIFHVLTVPNAYFPPNGDPSEILKVWHGGMAIFGALIGGSLAAGIWAHHKKYSLLLLADALAPGLLVAQAIGRLGNWFNQELYGMPTTLPWGLKLNSADAIGKSQQCYTGSTCPAGTLFHPTFLYEMIWNLIGAAIIVWGLGKIASKLKVGMQMAFYLMWYGLGRSWIEMLRINLSSEILGIRTNVWAAIICIILGIALFCYLVFNGQSLKAARETLAKVTAADLAREAAEEGKGKAAEEDAKVDTEDEAQSEVESDGEAAKEDADSKAEADSKDDGEGETKSEPRAESDEDSNDEAEQSESAEPSDDETHE